MIRLQNLTKQYQIHGNTFVALENTNLEVHRGEIFGVIGPSGAGKSTLIRCVNMLEHPSSGQVYVDNEELTKLSQIKLRLSRRKIGMIFQHFNLLSSRTVYENIALPLELSGKSKSEINTIISPLLELTNLVHKKNYYPSQLSGGQKQRVAIARALANKPKLLLSDEATSSLDPETTHSILQLLKDINKKLGLTILMITHEMDVVKEICHRLAILERGKIIEQGNVIDFFSNPKTEIARRFIRKTLKHHLPEALKQRLLSAKTENANPLLRISFIGKAAQEPIISEFSRKLNINLNILQANIEQITDETVGVMVLEVSGDLEKLQEGIDYFTNKGVLFEVIGYVEPHS